MPCFYTDREQPWIAFKVLAAGAIQPKSGFKYAFENGADFVAVGMFDFEADEDVRIAREVLKELHRERPWRAFQVIAVVLSSCVPAAQRHAAACWRFGFSLS